MKRVFPFLVAISIIITACTTPAATSSPTPLEASPASTSTPEAAPVSPTVTSAAESIAIPAAQDDFFTQNEITLATPTCSAPTIKQTEGPYYTANTPERNDLFEEGMPGTRLIVVGYVLGSNCQPIPNAWLDFWQADANGVYDNAGYTLRGHQFTDAQGRYYLETVVPGEYPGRTEHIHVKIQPNGGSILTTQLYFPDVARNSSDGIFDPSLIVQIEERSGYIVAYFNFVV